MNKKCKISKNMLNFKCMMRIIVLGVIVYVDSICGDKLFVF